MDVPPKKPKPTAKSGATKIKPNVKRMRTTARRIVLGVFAVIGAVVIALIVLVTYLTNTPSAHRLKSLDANIVATRLPWAEEAVQSEFPKYGFNLSQAVSTSRVDLCFWTPSSTDEFFSHQYDKGCNFRMTAFYPISGSFQQALSAFEAAYNVSDSPSRSSGILSSEPPCTEIMVSPLDSATTEDFDFCPGSTSVASILTYLNDDNNDVNDYELRGPLDTYSPGDPSTPGTIISQQRFNLAEDIDSKHTRTANGFVMVGVSDQYFYFNALDGGHVEN